MFSKKLLALSFSALILSSVPAFAKMGTESGGGGDASEERVNEIRSDILSWINNGGAKGLSLPRELSYGEYVDKMTDILQPKKVVVEFTEKDVKVKEALKTCKGFIARTDSKSHILCNISRFKNTSESEQYKLIHHEYAGLVNVENNEEAASDYAVSSQITDFLQTQSVLRLAVKKAKNQLNTNSNICISHFQSASANGIYLTTCTGQKEFTTWTYGNNHESNKRPEQEMITDELRKKGFTFAGSYFDGVLLHIVSPNPSDRYCLLARHEGHAFPPSSVENIIDCGEGTQTNIKPASLDSYLRNNGYEYVETANSNYPIFDGKDVIGAKILVYKKSER
jgi:hypothetical protein